MIRWERLNKDEIMKVLDDLSSNDHEIEGGRLFSHIYDPGIDELKEISISAYLKYIDKTMLNFAIFPSILKMEREVIHIVKKLLNGGDEVAGNYTYGGTESIFLALKTARDYMKANRDITKPNIVIPYTGHPAFLKSADYLDIEVRYASLTDEYTVDVDDLNKKIDRHTIAIIGSAPNYPYGTIDNIKALSEIALEKDIWLHVDACIGGFVLPFLKDLGLDIPPYDFTLEGVSSISIDLHKYGYTPKGGSIILYRNRGYRLHQIYINASWPGYPLVNTTVLSSRSAGPLAAAYTTLKYLGYRGYLELTKKILEAKEEIMDGLERLGFRILGKPVSSIVTFTSDDIDLFILAEKMRSKGWYIQLQPGSLKMGFPPSIHLTISPVHSVTSSEFIEDLKQVVEEVRDYHIEIPDEIPSLKNLDELIELLGLKDLSFNRMDLVNRLIYMLPPEEVEKVFKEVINKIYP